VSGTRAGRDCVGVSVSGGGETCSGVVVGERV
jgi:hypothetical protein